ncbi:MAG: TIM barrel protein [Thermodesulfobacteriota bacterium]
MEINGFTVHGHVPYPIARERIKDILASKLSPDIYISGNDLDHGIDLALLKEIKNECRTISFHGPLNDMTPGGVDEAFRMLTVKRIHQTLDIAEDVQPEVVLFHAGYDKKRYDGRWDIWLEQSIKTWKDVSKRINDLGVIIALENVFEESPFVIKTLLSHLAIPILRFCLDSAHAMVFSDIACYEWLEEMHPYLAELHIHNTRDKKKDEHNSVSDGIIDFGEILGRVKELGIHPLLTLEVHNEEGLMESIRTIEDLLATP